MSTSDTSIDNRAYSIQAACMTHKGNVRKKNEDAMLCSRLFHGETMEEAFTPGCEIGPPWTVIVADGIGGNLAGERASHEAVKYLSNLKDYTKQSVHEALLSINDQLQELGESQPEMHGMGTTVAGLACGSEGLMVYHLGDSRVYRIQDEYLAPLTRDDSVAEMLRGQDEFPVETLPASIRRALTQCLGGKFNEEDIKPHFISLQIRKPTRFLLCTDGLSESISHEQLEKLCTAKLDLIDITESLMDRVLSGKAKDNITIILAEVSPVASTPRFG